MNIVITGANGFLGSRLVLQLSKKHNIYAVVRENSNIDDIKNCKINVVVVDNLSEVLKGCDVDVVINTAALYGRKDEPPSDLFEANIMFPQRIFEMSQNADVEMFVNVGTSLPDNVSLYAFSKNLFSRGLKLQTPIEKKMKVVNLRLEHFYGVGDGVSKFTSHIFDACIKKKSVDLTEGKQCRDFVHVYDVVAAILVIVENGEMLDSYEDIDVGSGYAPSIREFVELAKSISKSTVELNFGALDARENEVEGSCANLDRLKQLGWVRKYSLKQGVEQVFSQMNS